MGRPVILEKYPYTYLRTIIMKKNLLSKSDYDKILKMSPSEIGKYLEDFEYKKEVDEFLKDFLNVPKLKRRLNPREMKKLILSQYEERILKQISSNSRLTI